MYCAPTRIFGMADTSVISLSIVVPIGPMFGQLENLLSWIDTIQDYPAQVILVVDEKNDGTYAELIRALEQRNILQSVLVLNAVCNGPGKARNLGTSEAKGKWITYWDSDDRPIVKETFRAIQQSEEGTDAIVCRYEKINESGEITSPMLSGLQIALNPGIWRFVFKRESFTEMKFPDLRLAEDQIFLILSGVFSKKLEFYNTVCYQYIQSSKNQLTKDKRNLPDLLKALDLLSDHSRSKIISASTEKNYLNVIIFRLSLTSIKNNPAKTIRHFLKNPDVLMAFLKSAPFLIITRIKN